MAVGTSVEGNDGTVSSGAAKLSALVRSPTTPRRHADRFGTSAPNRVSRKRSSDVRSKRSDATKPPRLKGEITSSGTRNPSPIGPETGGFPITLGSGTGAAVTYSPGVPGGAVSGGT